MIREFVEATIMLLQARADFIAKQTGEGAAESWDDYKARVGRVQGIKETIQELKAMLSKAERDDDD